MDQLEDDLDNETEHERNVIEEFRCENSDMLNVRKESSSHIIDPRLICPTDYLRKRVNTHPLSP